MKLKGEITINGEKYPAGTEVPWFKLYPFFLFHMAAFGTSGFVMAYAHDGAEIWFLYLHGGFACFVYLMFYLTIFGKDQVKWMLINSALGLFGIYAQIDLILSLFGKQASDYSVFVHFIPFLYYILYTFLLYQLVLDVIRARDNPGRRRLVEACYVVLSILVYGLIDARSRHLV